MPRNKNKAKDKGLDFSDCLGCSKVCESSRVSEDQSVVMSELKDALKKIARPNIQPKPFSLLSGPKFDEWLLIFEDYTRQSDLDEDAKRYLLLSLLEGDASKIARLVPKDHKKSYSDFVSALKQRFQPKLSPREYRQILKNRRPKSNEDSIVYSDALRWLVDKAYPDRSDVDCFVLDHFLETVNLPDGLTRSQLYLKKFTSAQESIDFVHAWEIASRESVSKDHVSSVSNIESNLESRLSKIEALLSECCSVSKSVNSRSSVVCYRCDRTGHIARVCNVKLFCNRCNKPGHIARKCFQGNEARVGFQGGTNPSQKDLQN